MGFFRKTKPGQLRPLTDREEHLLSRISELERFIEEGPARVRRQREDELSTMPPPDDLEDRRREHRFYTDLSRGEIRNERRYQTRSAVLFLLLVAAISALSSWIYSVLNAV